MFMNVMRLALVDSPSAKFRGVVVLLVVRNQYYLQMDCLSAAN